MTDLSYKETEKNLYYQMLFRFLVGLAGIATYALLLKDRGDTYHLASLTLTTILYIISTHFLAKFVKKETRVVVASFLPVTDAFLLGAMVGFLSLDLLAILLFSHGFLVIC